MNAGEKRLVKWQFGYASGFTTSLFLSMAKADDDNLKRFAKGFPEEVAALIRFRTEDGYWQKLINEFNELHKTNLKY